MRALFLAALAASAFAPAVGAATVAFTGAELLSAPGGTVFGTAIADGDAAIFSRENETVGFNEVIYRLEALPADPTRQSLRITLSVDYVAATDDNDPGFFLADGTNTVGFGRVDNQGGQARFGEGADLFGASVGIVGALPALGPVEPFTFSLVAAAGAATTARYSEGADAGTASFAAFPLDPRGPIAFTIRGADPSERYRIESVRITTAPVPLPASGIALLAGLAGLAAAGRIGRGAGGQPGMAVSASRAQ